MATSALATAFVNIVPGTVELERYLKTELGTQAEMAGRVAGKKLAGGLSQSLTATGSALTGIGTRMSLAITAPLALIGAQAIKSSADFGVTMATMKVNAEATGVQMKSLSDLAIKMGADTVFSAGEAATAMLELSKGGMSIAAIESGALAASMNLAATEGIALGEAAGIVIQAMNQFNIPAEQAGMAVDVLAAGAVASTASIYDLAGGLKYVGTTANSLGLQLPDVVTGLAALNNAGIDATTAGTSLNSFMLRLIPTTRKAAEEAAALGLEFVDASGKLKPMSDVVRELQAKYEGMGDAARVASLKTIFGVEGMRAANVFIQQGAEGWDKLAESVNKQGVASDLANARMSGLAGTIEKFKGSVDTAILSVGDKLDPAFSSLTDTLTDVVNAFADLEPEQQKAIVSFGVVAAIVGPLLTSIGALATAVGFLTSGWVANTAAMVANRLGMVASGIANAALALYVGITSGAIWANITAWVANTSSVIANTVANVASKAALVATTVATGLATAAQWALNVALTANPIGIVVVALAALAAGLIYFFTQTKEGQEAWGNFTKFLGETMTNIGKFFADVWKGISDGFKGTMNGMIKWFEGFVNFFVDGINTVIKAINALAKADATGLIPTLPLVKKVKFQAFAEGGFVTGPTNALIGEAGPEVVVPLNRFEKMMGIDGNGSGKTINYYAAPNQSVDAEQALFQAIKRAKVVAGW